MRALFAILALILIVGCNRAQRDTWGDPYARLLTTIQPKQEDIVGNYLLTQQTISTNDIVVLKSRKCELSLHPDGSFEVTDFPTWTNNGRFASFISTSGQWRCATAGVVYDNQTVWGVRFSDASHNLDLLSFTGKTAPYGLILTDGDPDDGTVIIFEKMK